MSLNETPSANRVHIGFFGMRNAGKSSVVNAVTGQNLSIVSNTPGTTTDPVSKAMELLPLGPVVIIDTPGLDDEGALGELRVKKAKQILNKTDIAVLCVDAKRGMTDADRGLVELFKAKDIPYIIVFNKSDLLEKIPEAKADEIYVSAVEKTGIHELKERVARLVKSNDEKPLVGDLLKKGDTVLLVVPIDSAAPKGRIILPQQQMIRDILDSDCRAVVVKENAVVQTLADLKAPPAMVITDSQVFETVAEAVPRDIPLTSFSILMARYKGFLETAVKGVAALKNLKDGDTILIAEGCTHHRQCNDIGTVKMPGWIEKYTGRKFNYKFTSGTEFPEDLSGYSLIVHCGGCMLNEREMRFRSKSAQEQGVPFTNYGTAIAAMHGILARSLSMFPDLQSVIE